MRIAKGLFIIGLCLIVASGMAFAADKKMKAGFVYVGPVGDYGWSHAHDMGRKFAEQKLPWLETVFIESGTLFLGTWQGIYFCEFDGPRKRKLTVKVITSN